MTQIEHLYIHIPFCTGKCSYCAFFSKPYIEEVAEEYIDSLVNELNHYIAIYGQRLSSKTIYIGGGTPTTLTAGQLETLLASLSEFNNVTEFTVETNPGLLTEEKLKIFKQYGVNRVSIGVQSLDDDVLKYLNRRHNVKDVEKTLELLKRYDFQNVSIDLISSLPKVSEADWLTTVKRAISWCGVKHMSVYCLSIEEETQFARMIESGELVPNSDDVELKMGAMTVNQLQAAGYHRYEISNYAKPGYECAHNLAYWHGKDFLGIGAGASSRLGMQRMTNVESIESYIKLVEEKHFDKIPDAEILSEQDNEIERLMFMLRLEEGIVLDNSSVSIDLIAKLDDLVNLNMVEFVDNSYRVKPTKRELTNSICEFLL